MPGTRIRCATAPHFPSIHLGRGLETLPHHCPKSRKAALVTQGETRLLSIRHQGSIRAPEATIRAQLQYGLGCTVYNEARVSVKRSVVGLSDEVLIDGGLGTRAGGATRKAEGR